MRRLTKEFEYNIIIKKNTVCSRRCRVLEIRYVLHNLILITIIMQMLIIDMHAFHKEIKASILLDFTQLFFYSRNFVNVYNDFNMDNIILLELSLSSKL